MTASGSSPDHGARGAGHPVRPQGGARRPAPAVGDDQPGRLLYAALDAPFLFAVQIIVYTGAILMLFPLRPDAGRRRRVRLRRRDDPGQRVLASSGGLALGWSWSSAWTDLAFGTAVGLDDANGGEHPGARQPAVLHYVSASRSPAPADHRRVGAMVLAHRERLTPKPTQARWPPSGSATTPTAEAPRAAPATGRVRRHNAVDTPRCCPTAQRRGLGLARAGHAARCARRLPWPTTSRR